jgi:hypothetical protein
VRIIGVALGNIMANIIAAHIKKSGSNVPADNPAPVLPSICMPRHSDMPLMSRLRASWIIQIQATAAIAASAAAMIQRSRREIEEEGALIGRGLISVMNARDEAGLVRIRKTHLFPERNGAFAGGGALSRFENEAGAVIDGDLFGIAGDRVLDRLEGDPKFVAAEASRAL